MQVAGKPLQKETRAKGRRARTGKQTNTNQKTPIGRGRVGHETTPRGGSDKRNTGVADEAEETNTGDSKGKTQGK